MKIFKKVFKFLIFYNFLFLILNGCSTSPDSNLSITLKTPSNLNPDVNGRTSPVDIHIFQLKNKSTFEQNTFFNLYNNAKKSLDQDLIADFQIEIKPNDSKDISLIIDKHTQFLGILVAFYNIEQAHWRETILIDDIQSKNLIIYFGSITFSINKPLLQEKK